jgi:hypothetical protein
MTDKPIYFINDTSLCVIATFPLETRNIYSVFGTQCERPYVVKDHIHGAVESPPIIWGWS